MNYQEFLKTKIEIAKDSGFKVERDKINKALLPHQIDAVLWALRGGRRALFESFGLGKCHGKGTKILMYDCTVKNVEDVKVGDLLMGDDGTPRKVLSLANGKDDMYKITLKNGDSFTCNSAHILSCEMSNKHNGHKAGDVVNIPTTEYLELPEYAKRNCYKAYKRPLSFKHKDIDFDAYVYGLWLGDGTKRCLNFTINDKDIEIVDYLRKWARSNNLQERIENGRGCKTYCYSQGESNSKPYYERDFIKQSVVNGEKRINKRYLQNDRKTRLNVLAGLLDTDGYLIDNCYEIATVFQGLKDDILFLCRSLGFSVTHTVKVVNGKEYQRIYISGNTDEIPCLTRKKASERKQIKNPLRYGFEVEYIGKGEYYGFTISGNHLYMLADFTVTHNTVQELEFCKQVTDHEGGQALIVCPLGVKQEFTHDAVEILGYEKPPYCKTMEEVKSTDAKIILTNYERVRDGDIDPTYFTATSLDEASVLRSFGSKTYQTFLDKFKGVPYKLVATATPSPNKYKELIHYAGYLEIMDTGQALTRFFQRDSTKANNLTLYPNMEDEFWLWMSSWALFITKPSDLNPNYSDEGYELPPLVVNWHELALSKYGEDIDKGGQMKLFTDAAEGLKEAAQVKRESIDQRIAKMVEIVNASPDDNFLLWHDLESERHAIKKALPETVDIYGSQDYDIREQRVLDFSYGKTRLFATKKSLSGSGCNFQRYCHREIFLGIDYEFNDFIQAIHRCYRFLQNEPVVIDIIYMESEKKIKEVLLEKWENHNHMVEKMIEIVKKYGLSSANMKNQLERKMGVNGTREERTVKGKYYTAVYGDCVEETREMETNSVDLIHTSIPFGNHYEYSQNYNDFGHNKDTDRFFEQMDFLTPELLRVLRPGRVAAIHVKDRVLFGNATGTGMPTIEPFHALCIEHYMKHGFQYFGMITVVTDVVRENNQTYRLGWTEQCKDGSKMGVGCPEYILLFRKLPTDRSTAYADVPVTKSKDEYTRAQWQIDAHGYWRASGDRLVSKDELAELPVENLQRVYREYSRSTVYNYEEHVELAKKLDSDGKLPAVFMVVAPGSWNTLEVWDDINRMRTLNTNQSRRRQQMHVCPLQLEIVERIINRYSNEGDLIYDPFGGLMTVPMTAVKMGRLGYGCELNADYFRDGVGYLQSAENEIDTPTLFDFLDKE